MVKPPPTVRAFIAGVSGSGKSTAARKLYLDRFPRRLLLDQTGEWAEHSDIVVYDVREVSWALRKYAPTGRWTICCVLDTDDIPDFVDYLIPIPQVERSPILLCGGAVLLMDEIDLVAPPQTSRREIRTIFRRSRHVGLSVVATTQRPENVSREVSAQSQHVLCMNLVEPRALEYMAELMQTDIAHLAAWTARHPHGGLWRESITGRTLWLTESGQLVQPGPEQGLRLVRGAQQPASPSSLSSDDDETSEESEGLAQGQE